MSVRRIDDGAVILQGDCPSEDAEALLGYLLSGARVVDWRDCDTAHTAVVQVLMAAGVTLTGPPRGEFLRRFVEPALLAQ